MCSAWRRESQDLNSGSKAQSPWLNYRSSNFLFWKLRTSMLGERPVLHSVYPQRGRNRRVWGKHLQPTCALDHSALEEWMPGDSGSWDSVPWAQPLQVHSFSELASLLGIFLLCPPHAQLGYCEGGRRLSRVHVSDWRGIKWIADSTKITFSNQCDYWYCFFHVLNNSFHFSTGPKLRIKRKGPQV